VIVAKARGWQTQRRVQNRSQRTGHSIRSKSMRRTSAGGITGHTASSDASTFSRLIFRERGMGAGILAPAPGGAFCARP